MSGEKLRNCKVCGGIFLHYAGIPLCGKCQGEMENIYQKARRFLRKAKQGERYDSLELAEILEVDPVFIHILIQEGRLEQEGIVLHDPQVEKKKVLAHLLATEADRLRDKMEFSSKLKSTGTTMHVSERKKKR